LFSAVEDFRNINRHILGAHTPAKRFIMGGQPIINLEIQRFHGIAQAAFDMRGGSPSLTELAVTSAALIGILDGYILRYTVRLFVNGTGGKAHQDKQEKPPGAEETNRFSSLSQRGRSSEEYDPAPRFRFVHALINFISGRMRHVKSPP
jgi:hypothetical protein